MCAWHMCMWSCISWEAISYSRCVSLWMLTGLRVAFLDKVIEKFKASCSWWVTAYPKTSRVCCSTHWHAICSYLLVFKCITYVLTFVFFPFSHSLTLAAWWWMSTLMAFLWWCADSFNGTGIMSTLHTDAYAAQKHSDTRCNVIIIMIITLSSSWWARYVQDKSCFPKTICLAHLYTVYQFDSFDDLASQHHWN